MRRLVLLVLVLGLAACADAPAPQDEAPPSEAAPVEAALTPEAAAGQALGVGARAPDFALPDAMGRTVRLSDLLAEGPVVLTFYRGEWCPYCNTQLRDYQAALDEVRAEGARLLAVSPQTPDGSLTVQDRHALAFPVLSDVGNRVSRDYGLVFEVDDETRRRYQAVGLDLAAVNGTDAWELPVPATYVIDTDGRVRAAFVEADYTQRASTSDVLAALAALTPATRS